MARFVAWLAAPIAAAAALLAAPGGHAETFTVLPEQTFDVDQPGPRGDIAIWLAEPPAAYNAIRACARVVELDPHRLFSPAFAVVLIAGDEVLRLKFVNDDRRTNLLPAYIRRDSVEAPETATLAGSRRKPVKKEVRMGPVVEVGQTFDLGMSWTPQGVVDVMVRVAGRENHVSVRLKTAPTKIRVVASSGTWRLTPFEFGNLTPDDPDLDPDLRPRAGCEAPAASRIAIPATPDEDRDPA